MSRRLIVLAFPLALAACDPAAPSSRSPALGQWNAGVRELCYVDRDGDGSGVGDPSVLGDPCPAGWAHFAGDCDDGDATVSVTRPCYADGDGDHYGAGDPIDTCAATCSGGLAESAGDCDDRDAAVHPHNFEISSNDVDDDCDGAIDEAEPLYTESGVGNAADGFDITLALHDAASLAAFNAGSLKAKIYYRKLENASSPYSVAGPTAMTRGIASAWTGAATATFHLGGLEHLKVYEARVDLYDGSTRIQPSGCAGSSLSATPCSNSDVYYTITLPASGDSRVWTGRANVVLSALYEFRYFRTHPLGSWDDSLQYRYQLAAPDSAYCSEFYANAAEPYLVDMNPCKYKNATATPQCDPGETSDSESMIGRMKSWFSAYPLGYSAFEDDPDFSGVKPGDWLGVNPTADEPDGQHTQMFLAYDAAAGLYWFVEGNGSYSNAWGPLAHTSDVASHLRDGGAGWYCPSGAATVTPSGCYYIKSVGHVNATAMLD